LVRPTNIPFAAACASLLAVFAALFTVWTATSAWSFPCFVVAVLSLFYIPGRVVIDSADLDLPRLDHCMLSLVTGMTASSMWFCIVMYVNRPLLFWTYPFASVAVYLYRAGRSRHTLLREVVALDGSHGLLFGLIMLAVAPLAVLPAYYRNLANRADGGLSFSTCDPDVAFHLSIANELTHSIPPEVPFFAGRPLSYHCGMDLVTALLNQSAGLNVLDLTVRFLPTLYTTMTVLAVFCFARAWLRTGYAAVLTAFLIMLAEDFSFVPGILHGSPTSWSKSYFGVPTTFSLYYVNAILPAQALLFAGFYCLRQYSRTDARIWLALTSILLSYLVEYKVFSALQLFASLGLASLYYLVRYQQRRLLKVFTAISVCLFPFALTMWQANEAGGGQSVRPYHTYIPMAFEQLGYASSCWGHDVIALLRGQSITLRGATYLLLVALPGYFVGSLGLRFLALPILAKDLMAPRAESSLRFLLTLFVTSGFIIALCFTVIPKDGSPDRHYNNAVWFYVQSKYVVCIFAVEALLALRRRWQPGHVVQALAVLAVITLSLPSTIQCFYRTTRDRPLASMSKDERELMTYLADKCTPGSVVLTRAETVGPIAAMTPCRVPMSKLFNDAYGINLVPAAELVQRSGDLQLFWECWDRSELRVDILTKYHISYLVIDKLTERCSHIMELNYINSKTRAGQSVYLDPCFDNERFTAYCVRLSQQAGLRISAT
jgi:hypothetical protein